MIQGLCSTIDRINSMLGRAVMWLALAMVAVQFTTVVMRYVFGVGSLMLYESIIYMHGILFMSAAAYTLVEDRHVRVDIFFRDASPRRKALVNLVGTLLFLLPVCLLVLYLGFPYVARSWATLEGSRETSGIPGIFVLKTFILVFGVTMLAQAVAMVLRSLLVLTGREPGRESGDPRSNLPKI